MEPRLLRRGNMDRTGESGRGAAVASMEPRLLRRGNPPKPQEGATKTVRFNGATPSQTWKPGAGIRAGRYSRMLQWSHAFSDVETRWRSRPVLPRI